MKNLTSRSVNEDAKLEEIVIEKGIEKCIVPGVGPKRGPYSHIVGIMRGSYSHPIGWDLELSSFIAADKNDKGINPTIIAPNDYYGQTSVIIDEISTAVVEFGLRHRIKMKPKEAIKRITSTTVYLSTLGENMENLGEVNKAYIHKGLDHSARTPIGGFEIPVNKNGAVVMIQARGNIRYTEQ